MVTPGLITREHADTLNAGLAEIGRLVQGFRVAPPLSLTDDAGGVSISMEGGGSGYTGTLTIVSNVECSGGTLTVSFRDLTFESGLLTAVGSEY